MNQGNLIIAFLLVGVMLFSSSSVLVSAQQTQVPPEYAKLYSTLQATLDDYSSYLATRNSSQSYPAILGTELLPANANRGPALLGSGVMQGVTLYLNRLQELGVGGVTVAIGYPLYTPAFPRYQEYVQFYKQVAQEIRKRGMKLDVESSVVFANSPFSPIAFNYADVTWEQFEIQRKQMIASIIQDIQPDYLNLGAEPDTEYKLTGFQQFNSPDQYTAYINTILTGLNRGNTLVGAGIGTWGNIHYIQEYVASTSLDFIDMHVYPIVGAASLQSIFTIAEIAKQHSKKVILDEAWLYKVATLQATSIAANTDIFRLDAFSFWAPLDQQFIGLIVKSARMENIEYVSPFWSTLFFSYVDYDSDTAQLPYSDLESLVNSAAVQNVANDQFSSTGLFYGHLTGAHLSTASSSSTKLFSSTTTNSVRPIPTIGIEALIGGIIVGVLTLVLILRRQARKSKNKS